MSPIDFNGLDSQVHGPMRLGILTSLHLDGKLDFTTIRKRLQATDGALGTHLTKLEKVGYIKSHKTFVGRRPRTTYRLQPKGRTALAQYFEAMRELLASIENHDEDKGSTGQTTGGG